MGGATALPRPRRTLATLPMGFWVLLLCAGQVLLWGSAFGLSYSAPEIDSAEQFVWAFSLENGYWKHPPGPSWIMHALMAWVGPSIALPFVAAQVCIVIALALTWRLGCEFMSPRRSLLAMALVSLVTYHNFGADNFNHNTALLPFQAAMVLMFFLATRRGGLHRWALAGLFAGLAMLVKYVALMPIAGLLLYLLLDRRQHNRGVLVGLLVASVVFALALLPHLLWLQRTDFLPFRYAQSVTQPAAGLGAAVGSVADFLTIQLARLLPFLIGLAWLLRYSARRASAPAPARPIAAPDRLFIVVAAVTPLLLTIAFCLVTRTELQSRWGTNGFLLVGLLAMALWPRAETGRTTRRVIVGVITAQCIFAAGLTLGKTVLADRLQHPTRANFPGAVLAAEASKVWSAQTAAPLRIVVSDTWLGGNIIAHRRDRVAVLIDGHPFKSPWVKEQAVRACGALVLNDLTSDGKAAPNAALDALMARATASGVWNLPWAVSQDQATEEGTGRVRWGVIAPKDPAACDLR